MKNKRRNGFMILGGFLVLLAFLVWAVGISIDGVEPVDPLTNRTQMSGVVNLTALASVSENANITSVNFTFTSGGEVQYVLNISNSSVNQLHFGATADNLTLDTIGNLSDGVYNLTINATAFNDTKHVTNTTVFNVTIDNTPPAVTSLLPTSGQNYTISSSNQSFSANVTDATTGVSQVIFQFDNATGNSFNSTLAVNNSGLWNISFNVSELMGGFHTVTVIANDTVNNSVTKPASNYNRTQTLTFTVNTAPNVTIITSPQGGNFSITSSNKTFNVSVVNSTTISGVNNVILEFDNATGTAFNRTAVNTHNEPYARYWLVSYNVSQLVAGNHTVKIFANDSNANVNRTVNVTFVIDFTAPSVSISCDPSSVEQSAAAPTCTCTATDEGENQTGVQTKVFNPDPSTAETGTITTKICQATDYAGNSRSATGTFTVTEAAASGSGTGGSGGGSSSSAKGQFAKTTWTSIFSGETATVAVDNGEVGVTEISFDVTKDVYGAWLSVNKKDSFPKSVSDFARKEYKKLEISKGPALKEDTFKNAKVKFKVLKTWLAENKLEKGGVALFHYDEDSDKWSELSTTVGEDDGTYVHYTAETPGFSYFVIGEREKGAAPLPETVPAEVPSEAVPTEAPSEAAPSGEAPVGEPAGAPAWPWALVALVVVGVAVALYLMKKR